MTDPNYVSPYSNKLTTGSALTLESLRKACALWEKQLTYSPLSSHSEGSLTRLIRRIVPPDCEVEVRDDFLTFSSTITLRAPNGTSVSKQFFYDRILNTGNLEQGVISIVYDLARALAEESQATAAPKDTKTILTEIFGLTSEQLEGLFKEETK